MATLSTNDIKIRYDIDLSKLQQASDVFDKITSEERQLLNELGKLKKQFEAAGLSATTAANNAARGMSDIEKATQRVGNAIVTYFSVTKIYEFSKAVINTTIQFESLRKAINFTSGSIEAGAANMEFLRNVSKSLGISLEAAASGFKAISASANQAGYSNLQTQKIFENVSKAVAAFGLSSDDAAGVFRALSQIISKGTVQAEELRGQIGDRIPGAFSIAAKAMGVTEKELNKLMATGKVTAAEFVVPFTQALGKMSEQASTLDSMGKGFQRFQNAWQAMMETLGRQVDENVGIGKFVNTLTRTLDFLATATQTAMQEQEKAMGKGYQAIMDSEIVTYDKARKEKVKIAIQNQIELTKAEIDGANQRLKAQKKELEESSPFRLYGRQVMRANIRAIEDEIEAIGLRTAKYQGELKALDELINKKEKVNQLNIDPKELAKEYQERLRLLQLEKELANLRIKINFTKKADILREEYKAEEKYLKDVYDLQVKYSDLGVQAAIDGIEKTRLQRELNKVETIRGLKEETQSTLDSINKMRMEYKKNDEERAKAQKESVDRTAKTNFEKEQLEIKLQEKLNDLDEKFAKERIERAKREEEEKLAIREKAIELGSTLVNGAFNLYQANLSNEMTLLQKRYDQEIKLADGNQQKIDELNQKKAEKEKEINIKQFKAQQAAAIANIIFELGQQLVKYSANPLTAPLAALSAGIAAAQIGFIMAQPVPEFAEGTKGKPFKGGKAIVGERGVEKVVTESGKVYFTPPTATLVDLPKGSQVIPNHALSRQELFLANHYANRSSSTASPVVGKLDELGSILKGLPITQLSMDEKGFEKYIRTPRRSTKILNNRFGIKN